MRTIAAALLLLTSVAGRLPAETFNHARDGFTISVPAGWTEISKPDLARITAEGRKALQAGNSPEAANAPEFAYGYRGPAGDMKFPPYVLVWIRKNGRMPEEQIKAVPKMDNASITKEARTAAGSVLQGLAINSTAYDESKHILWATSEATYPGIGAVGILNGCVLTEEGGIWVYGYAPRDRFDEVKPALASIVESVQLSETLRYKPRALDYFGGKGFNIQGVLTYALIGGVVAMVVGLIIQKRAKPAA